MPRATKRDKQPTWDQDTAQELVNDFGTPSLKRCVTWRVEYELATRYEVCNTITAPMYKRAVALLNGSQPAEWTNTRAVLRKIYPALDTLVLLQRKVKVLIEKQRTNLLMWQTLENTEVVVNLALSNLDDEKRAEVAKVAVYGASLTGATAKVDQEGYIHFDVEADNNQAPGTTPSLVEIANEYKARVEEATQEYLYCVFALYKHLGKVGASEDLTKSVQELVFKLNQEVIVANFVAPKYTGSLPTPQAENTKELNTEGYEFYKDERINNVLAKYNFSMRLEDVVERRKGIGEKAKQYLKRWEEQ